MPEYFDFQEADGLGAASREWRSPSAEYTEVFISDSGNLLSSLVEQILHASKPTVNGNPFTKYQCITMPSSL